MSVAGDDENGGEKNDAFMEMFGDSDDEDEEPQQAEAQPKGGGGEEGAGPSQEKAKGDDDGDDEDDEEKKKNQDFNAMFESDSDDDDFDAKASAPGPESAKAKLNRLANKTRGKAGLAKASSKYLTQRQKDSASQKDKQQKKKKEKQEKNLWDLVDHDSENDEEGEADDDDKKFIDNEDDDLFASSDDEAEAAGDQVARAPEAEEAEEASEDDGEMDEIERRIKKRGGKRKRKEQDPQAKTDICRSLLARMEAAYDADNEAVQQHKPAIHKLKLLKEVESTMIQRHMHETLLFEGALTVMGTWLEPLPDMTLPNVKVRSTLLRIIRLMRVRAEDHRLELLQKSRIGRIVMFLSKVSDEIPENKKIASKLCEGWTNDILRRDNPSGSNRISEEAMQSRLQGREKAGKRRRREALTSGGILSKREEEEEKDKRMRVSRPEPTQMDFKYQPASMVNHSKAKEAKVKASDKRFKEKFMQKTAGNQRFTRTTKMSIEGRGL